MFDKAISKFATLGRNTRLNKERKRRASIGGLFSADDTNNDRDRDGSFGNNKLQDCNSVDLSSDAILQLNRGLMRRSQSTESLNISLHQKWRTIDIDIDSPSNLDSYAPDNDVDENPYQDLNVLPLSRNDVDAAEIEVGYESDFNRNVAENNGSLNGTDENLYEDTDFVRESLKKLDSVKSDESEENKVCSVQNKEVCSESVSSDKDNVQSESNDNTPVDECDSDSEYHDTVVKDLNVIEISEQGIVSKLRNSDPDETISKGMDSYFERMGMKVVETDEEEEEEEEEEEDEGEEIEFDGIKSNRKIDELEQEDVKTANSEEDVFELNEVLSKFEIIEEDTRKVIQDQGAPKEVRTKPKLLPKPKPKPPLKPKPRLKPAKSLGCIESSLSSEKKNVFAIVTSFECESLPKPKVQSHNSSPKLQSPENTTICDTGSKSNHKETANQRVQPKDITSKLSAIFAKDVTMKPSMTITSPKVPPPPPPSGGSTGCHKSRFDSECESVNSGTDLSEQSSGTGSIGTPSLPAQSPRLPSHSVLDKPWSDQSSLTSNEGPTGSVSSAEDYPSAQAIGERGDIVILPAVTIGSHTNGAKTMTPKNKKKERQVSQRWQRNHLKKMAEQLHPSGAVKRKLQKIQNADNLKRFSNYLATKRASLDLLSIEPIQRLIKKKPEVPPPDYENTPDLQEDEDYDEDYDSEEWDDEDYENYDANGVLQDYENDPKEWTSPQYPNNSLNVAIAPPEQDEDQIDDGGYLAPEELAPHRVSQSSFMEPQSMGHGLGSPPSRPLPPTPPVNEPAPPALPVRGGRGPLPQPPTNPSPPAKPQPGRATPAKVLPPAPPAALKVAQPAPVVKKSPISPATTNKPTPPKKPGNSKISALASAFEEKMATEQPRPAIAQKPKPGIPNKPKPTGPSFLHSQGVPQASRIAAKNLAQQNVPNLSATSNDSEDSDDNYQPVDDTPLGPAPGVPNQDRPRLPPPREGPDTPEPRQLKDRNKGLVTMFPGMPVPDSVAIRDQKRNMKQNLENLFSNNNNGPNGRKGSTPTVSPFQPPSKFGPRKGSDPVIQSTPHLLANKFTKQKSVDQVEQTSRLGFPRNDRPLPAPPGTVASPLGRNPADRPLPPVPPQQGVTPPSPPVQSQPKALVSPNPAMTRGARTDRPLPAVPPSEEELTIYSYPWYFGDMNRSEASAKIKAQATEGVFLVRKSTQGGHSDPYTLIFYDGNSVHNLHIRRRPDNKYALGKEKDNELTFKTVPDLISFHQTNAIALAGGARTTLTTCPPRQ